MSTLMMGCVPHSFPQRSYIILVSAAGQGSVARVGVLRAGDPWVWVLQAGDPWVGVLRARDLWVWVLRAGDPWVWVLHCRDLWVVEL